MERATVDILRTNGVDEELLGKIENTYGKKYNDQFILNKITEITKVLKKRGVANEIIIDMYKKSIKLLANSQEGLDLKLGVFHYFGIEDRYKTHPSDLIQSANITYCRGMFLKEVVGKILVNDLFQKRATFDRKYFGVIDDGKGKVENYILRRYPFSEEVKEKLRRCAK